MRRLLVSLSAALVVAGLVAACSDSDLPKSSPETPSQRAAVPVPAAPSEEVSTPFSKSATPAPSEAATTPFAKSVPAAPSELAATARPAAVTSTASPVAVGRYGGTLNLVSREPIAHQDVHLEISPALSAWGPGIAYSRLLRFSSGPDVELPSLAVECELCESWTMENEQTFVFELRRDVVWQALPPVGGRELVAGDVVFSYDRQRGRDRPNAALLAAVVEVEASGAREVRISLAGPDADFLIGLADGHSKIVAREAVELSGDLRNGPTVGTGPWVLTETESGAAHVFSSNESYFEPGLPFLDTLAIHVIVDGATREAAFRVGAIDVHQMEPPDWEKLHRERPEVPFLMTGMGGTGLEVALKTTAPPFDDLRVRRAVFQAIDPWRAIEEIWFGAAFIGPGFPLAEPGWLLPEQELRRHFARPEAARELLRDARVDLPVPVTIRTGEFGDTYLAHTRRIADEMRAVGFEPTLDVVSRRVFGEEVWLGGEYEMLVGPIPPVTAPNGYLVPVLHSRGRWNTAGYVDDALDGLIEAQAGEYDADVRRDLVHEIQRRVLDGAYRFMPATSAAIWVWSPRVKNFWPNFAGFEYSHWGRVWVEE